MDHEKGINRDEGSLLAQKAAKCDLDAYEKLVRKFEKFVFNTVYFDVKNREDAFDISQEVFIKVYKSLYTFRGDSAFSSWLYRICKNCTYDFIRKENKNNAISISELSMDDDDKADFDIPDSSEKNNPEASYEKTELKKTVRNAIDKLSEEHKSVILLRDIEGYSYSEIAQTLMLEEGTVKSRISRARELLRKFLSDYMGTNSY